MHPRVLVLNTDCTPIATVDWKRALVLSIINQKNPNQGYMVMDYYNKKIKTAGGAYIPLPAVVRLAKYQKQRKKRISFSRKNVFLRDGMRCQYCGYYDPTGSNLTYDHVIPRAKWSKSKYGGTPTTWTNIVTACRKCNHFKGDKDLHASGLKLIKIPQEPNPHHFVIGIGPWTKIPKQWEIYLPPLYLELMKNNG